jgi:hypothetical protein
MNEWSTLQWIAGTIVATFLAGCGVILKIYAVIEKMDAQVASRIAALKAEASENDDRLWEAHATLAAQTQSFRENIIERLGQVAQRSDIEKVIQLMQAREDRIMNKIDELKGQKDVLPARPGFLP